MESGACDPMPGAPLPAGGWGAVTGGAGALSPLFDEQKSRDT